MYPPCRFDMVDVQPDDNISPAGTTAHSKEYTPYQVRLIVDALGEP